jgi:hypothetical protein
MPTRERTRIGWTRKYTIHTSANFERGKDQKLVAKVLVTCELTIFGLGSHSATGDEWADNDNAGTAAEAQSFKRACACFGLGRYLYYFTGTWVDLDDHKRPKSVPQLFGWGNASWLASGPPAEWFSRFEQYDECAKGSKLRSGFSCGNRGNGRATGPGPLPPYLARSGASLESARDRRRLGAA